MRWLGRAPIWLLVWLLVLLPPTVLLTGQIWDHCNKTTGGCIVPVWAVGLLTIPFIVMWIGVVLLLLWRGALLILRTTRR